MIQRLVITNWRPTPLNKLLYATVRRRIKLKKFDADLIGIEARNQGITKATGKRRICLSIYLSGRQKVADVDAYQKSTLDGLVTAGLLTGDRAEDVEWVGVYYARDRLKPQTVIVLEDLEGR